MLGRLRGTFAIILCLWTSLSAVGESLPFAGLDDLRGPYEGTGVSGEALHVQPLGDAGKWPICAYWSSARTESSPWLGYGWSIPALESRFVPLDTRRWAFYQPDGYVRIFVRAYKDDDNLLTGGPAWTAVCKGDVIRVTADPHDGGPKSDFTFRQGRLVRMSCEEGDFEIKYTGRTADRIVSRGKTLLEVTRETSPGERVKFRFSGSRAPVIAVCRPVVLVGTTRRSSSTEAEPETSLVALQTANGIIDFTYGGARDEAFFTAGRKRWTWRPYARKILTYGDWTYTIGSPKHEGDEPSFARRREDGCQESYSFDRKTGLLVQEFTNGTSRARKVFTSGPLAYRRARWTKETDKDGTSVRNDYTYDEAGRVIYRRVTRDVDKRTETDEVWLDSAGKIFRRRVNGEEVPTK